MRSELKTQLKKRLALLLAVCMMLSVGAMIDWTSVLVPEVKASSGGNYQVRVYMNNHNTDSDSDFQWTKVYGHDQSGASGTIIDSAYFDEPTGSNYYSDTIYTQYFPTSFNAYWESHNCDKSDYGCNVYIQVYYNGGWQDVMSASMSSNSNKTGNATYSCDCSGSTDTRPAMTSLTITGANSVTSAKTGASNVTSEYDVSAAYDQFGVAWYTTPQSTFWINKSAPTSASTANHDDTDTGCTISGSGTLSVSSNAQVAGTTNSKTVWVSCVSGSAWGTKAVTLNDPQYAVKFYDGNGNQFGSTQNIYYGCDASAPSGTPTKNYDSNYHYTFSSWGTYTNITNDTNVNANFNSISHSYTSSVTNQATCTSAGSTKYTCSCGYNYTSNTVPVALGHSFTSTSTDSSHLKSAATCTTAAVYYKSCSRCGANGTETFTSGNAQGHSFTGACANQSAGKHYYKCARCNTYGVGTTANATENCSGGTATCTAQPICTKCNTAYSSALGHNESAAWTTDANQHWKVCTRCGTITTAKANHTYGAWSTDTATCVAGGSHYRDCTVCGYRQTQTTPQLGHDFTSQVQSATYLKSAATCEAKAVYYYKCSRCAEKGTATYEYGSPLGHDYTGAVHTLSNGTHNWACTKGCGTYGKVDNGTQVKNGYVSCTFGAWGADSATCTEPGEHSRTCEVCSYVETETTPALNHHWVSTVSAEHKVSDATCVSAAVYHKWCDRCGADHPSETFTSGDVDANNHAHGLNKTDAVAAQCEAAGNIDYWTCPDCHRIYNAASGGTQLQANKTVDEGGYIVPATGHDYTGAVRSNGNGQNGTHSYLCKNGCGTYGVVQNGEQVKNGTEVHSWDSGSVTTPPTCTQAGVRTFTCTVTGCGATYTDNEPMNAHSYTEATVKTEALKAAADCETPATYWYSCEVCGRVERNDSHTFTDGEALGHIWKYDEAVFHWNGYACATATVTCDRDANHTKTETVTVSDRITTPATCTVNGVRTYTASFTDEGNTYTDAKTEDIGKDLTNHANGLNKTDAVTAQCEAAGNIDYWTCPDCHRIYDAASGGTQLQANATVANGGFIVPATGHAYTGEIHNAGAAGHNYACANGCGTYGVGTEKNATEAHTCGEWHGNTATCENPGTETRECSAEGCGYQETQPTAALGHNWDWANASYVWTDYTACAATVTCTRDPGHTQTINANSITSRNTTEATCNVEGIDTYTATFPNENLTAQTKEKNIGLAPTNHKAALTHTAAVTPTCTDPGNNEYWYCPDCGKYFKDAAGTQVTTVADETLAIVPTNHHLTKYTDALAATCVDTGLIDSWKCDYCGKIFSDANAGTEITQEETVVAIDAHNHPGALTEIPAVAATCIAEGNNRYYQCPDCHMYFTDAQGQNDTTMAAQTTDIDPRNHDGHVSAVSAVSATCTEDGNILYYHCSACGGDYADANGATAITDHYTDDAEPGYKVRAHGHNFDYANATYTWLNANGSVQATAVCTYDSHHTITETVDTTSTVIRESTCTEKGVARFTATFTNAAQTVDGVSYVPEFAAQSVTAELPLLDHTLVKTEAQAATCMAEGNITYWTCSSCGKIFRDSVGYTEITAEDTVIAIDPDAHAWGGWEIKEGDDDVHIRYCAHNHAHYETTAHVWGEWIEDTAATCMVTGTKHRVCDVCSKVQNGVIDIDPDNHDYDEGAVTTPATCTTAGVKTYTCSRNASHTKTEVIPIDPDAHNWDEGVVTTPATCTTEGVKTYTCTYNASHKRTEAVAVDPDNHALVETGAVAATCLEDGTEAYWTCSRCDKLFSDANGENEINAPVTVTAPGHNWSDWAVTTPATCTEDGVETRECARCHITETRPVEAPGHDLEHHAAQAATCTEIGWNAYDTCSRCDYTTYEEIPATGHTWGEWEETVAATCMAAGLDTRTCSVCGDTETRVGDINADAHSWGEWTQTAAPTCTEAGVKERVCAYNADHKQTEAVSALGHSLTAVEANAATCTEAGNNAYWTCARCGKNFADAEGTTEATDIVIDALGHSWGEWVVVEAGNCVTDKVERRECTRCHLTEDKVTPASGHDLAKVNKVGPTCVNAGKEEYYHCSICEGNFEDPNAANAIADLANWGNIQALGHDFTGEARDNENGTHSIKCSRCDVYDTAVSCTYGEWSADTATCLEGGTKSHTCAVCGHVETVETEALGHDLVSHAAQAATCTEAGWNAYNTCSRCDYTTYEEIPATGHHLVKTEAVPSTCHIPGTAAYYTCDNAGCGKMFADNVGYTEITQPAALPLDPDNHVHADGTDAWGAWVDNGNNEKHSRTCSECGAVEYAVHVWDDGHVTTEPTCTATGVMHYECTVCGYRNADETVPALGHSFPLTQTPATAATCTEDGVKTYYTCDVCGKIFADSQGNTAIAADDFNTWKVIERLGHNPGAAVTENENAATCEEGGSYDTVVYCKRCGAELSRETITVNALGHTYTKNTVSDATLKSAATCTQPAVYYYSCVRCDAVAGSDEYTFIVGTPLGHTLETIEAQAPTCMATGNNRYYHCTRCDEYFSDENATQPTTVADQTIAIDENAHQYGDWAVTTPATCTTDGVETRVCALNEEHKETRAITAPGHTPAAAVIENAVAATCEEGGSYDSVVYCSVCGAQISRETVEVSANGHRFPLKAYAAVAATCTETGLKAYYQCEACGKYFEDSEGHTVITEDIDTWKIVAQLGHDPNTAVKENEEAATCIAGGSYDEVIYCKRCEAEISRTEKTTPALGHSYTKRVVNDATLKSAATCTDPAVYYYSCVRCGAVANSDDYTFIVGTPLGHVLEKVEATAATCTTAGNEEYYRCTRENCGALFLDLNGTQATTLTAVTIPVDENAHLWNEGEVTTPATCVAEGVKTYTCAHNSAHTYTEVIPVDPDAHKVVDVEEHQDPTCTEAGYAGKQICELCGATLKEHEPIPALGHDPVAIPDVAQTCTDKGYINGVKCNRCGETLTEPQELPKLGHRYGDWTAYDADQHVRVCANDENHVLYADHEWDAGKAAPAATCSSAGVRIYTCKVCKATKNETIPANGNHSWGAWTYDADSRTHTRTCGNAGCDAAEGPVSCTFHSVITAYPASFGAEGTKTFTCDICGGRYEENFTATGMALGKETVTLKVGQSVTITAYVLPGNAPAAAGEVTWASRDESIATVDATGKITGAAPGTAVITATAIGYTKTVTVTVTEDGTVHSTYLKVTAEGLSTTQVSGKTIQLKAVLMPENVDPGTVEWTSSNSNVASVSSGGLVTYNATGTAIIYAKTTDGYSKGSITVRTTLDQNEVHNEDQTFTVIYTVGDCGFIINGETINRNIMVTYVAGSTVTFKLTRDCYVLINGVQQPKSADGTYTIERIDRNFSVTTSATDNAGIPSGDNGSDNGSGSNSGSGSSTGSGPCSYCGQTHTGFFGAIIGFFHGILYFFKNLFNR